MNEGGNKGGLGLTTIAAWGALFTTIISGGFTFGVLANRVNNLESQVRDMQAETRSNAAKLAEIQEGVTIIKTKFEVLVPSAEVRR